MNNDALTSISNVASSMISQHYKKLELAVYDQMQQRAILEKEIIDLVEQEHTKAKEVKKFFQSDRAH